MALLNPLPVDAVCVVMRFLPGADRHAVRCTCRALYRLPSSGVLRLPVDSAAALAKCRRRAADATGPRLLPDFWATRLNRLVLVAVHSDPAAIEAGAVAFCGALTSGLGVGVPDVVELSVWTTRSLLAPIGAIRALSWLASPDGPWPHAALELRSPPGRPGLAQLDLKEFPPHLRRRLTWCTAPLNAVDDADAAAAFFPVLRNLNLGAFGFLEHALHNFPSLEELTECEARAELAPVASRLRVVRLAGSPTLADLNNEPRPTAALGLPDATVVEWGFDGEEPGYRFAGGKWGRLVVREPWQLVPACASAPDLEFHLSEAVALAFEQRPVGLELDECVRLTLLPWCGTLWSPAQITAARHILRSAKKVRSLSIALEARILSSGLLAPSLRDVTVLDCFFAHTPDSASRICQEFLSLGHVKRVSLPGSVCDGYISPGLARSAHEAGMEIWMHKNSACRLRWAEDPDQGVVCTRMSVNRFDSMPPGPAPRPGSGWGRVDTVNIRFPLLREAVGTIARVCTAAGVAIELKNKPSGESDVETLRLLCVALGTRATGIVEVPWSGRLTRLCRSLLRDPDVQEACPWLAFGPLPWYGAGEKDVGRVTR